MRLEGKVALISGGARGLGAAEARLMASEGARVAIGDLREDQGQTLVREIGEDGGDTMFVRLDVTSEDDWTRAVKAVVDRFGKLNVLVNNAGIHNLKRIEEATQEDWDRVMEVNAKGVFLGTKAAIPAMRSAGGGAIVNISSTAGIVGSVISAAYNPSKAAVRLFTKSTALQHAKDGIRANSVHPGPAETDMLRSIYTTQESLHERGLQLPLGRFGRSDDIAYGVLFLASDESSYMTGSELVIDGGMTAQ